jgi:hypothetical protein
LAAVRADRAGGDGDRSDVGAAEVKPMHSTLTSVSRCKCCQSKYSRHGANRTNEGKSAARQQAKREMRKELRHD